MAKSAVPDGWHNAARAIMTTDTFAKVATATVKLGKTKVRINGMAKGAGMIAPDMATMLAFVFTDAPLSATVLQSLLKTGVEDTFNAVTIDGDTSTSDTLLAFATGAAAAKGAPTIKRANDPQLKAFTKAFHGVLADLAEQVARDGEGARKLVEVTCRRRDVEAIRAQDRDVDRQFAAGEDRHRRRGRQLGPRGDGRRQGRRAGQPRQAVDLVQRHSRRHQGRARSVLR